MTVLITGGVGFIGCNVAHRLLAAGERVRLLDDFSSEGVDKNAAWLDANHRGKFELVVGDVRNLAAVTAVMYGVDHVFHFAAQAAVATSLHDPISDFEVNAQGTLNVLEAARAQKQPPSIIYTSTNRVYGALDDVELIAEAGRYAPVDGELAAYGIAEKRPLQFHSPYGCSKGTADQYVLDWTRMFGLRAVVLRMSCIYGPRQIGSEDQGWVTHFLTRAIRGESITIFGDGNQVRDILFVDDLVDALLRVRADMSRLGGRAFNVGGGPPSTVSLLELVERIERLTRRGAKLIERRRPQLSFEDWRRADQRWYVSDTRELSRATGWKPKTSPEDGIARLFEWLEINTTARPLEARQEARP